MTKVSYSYDPDDKYVDPAIASYYAYECAYCQKYFYLVQPRDFQAGGCTRTVQYRNKETGEIKAAENRSEGICLDCAKEIMKRQQG